MDFGQPAVPFDGTYFSKLECLRIFGLCHFNGYHPDSLFLFAFCQVAGDIEIYSNLEQLGNVP